MDSQSRVDHFEALLRRRFHVEESEDIIDWLKKNIRSIPYSPMPGGFRTTETPWLEEILRAFIDPEIRVCTVKAPIQSGKSMALELLLCWIIARQPGPTLYLQDQDPNARDWYETRLVPLIDNCPPAQSQMNRKDSRWQSSKFDRMNLWTLGGHNIRNLQRRSIRWLIADEAWLFKPGHINEAMSRVKAYGWLGKVIVTSQGSYEGDEFSELHASTDQREWTFECPDCKTRQPFSWTQVRYPEGYKKGDEYDFRLLGSSCTYECCNCKRTWKDSPKSRAEMNASGKFVSMNGNAEKGMVGFHYNSIAVRSWGDLAVRLARAKEAATLFGDEEPRRIWKQKEMAETWSDEPEDLDQAISASDYRLADRWSDEGGYVKNEQHPRGILVPPEMIDEAKKQTGFYYLRFLSVDVQNNGFYCLIRSWSLDGRSRLVHWEFVQHWDQIEVMRQKFGVDPSAVFIDSGFSTGDVYAQTAKFGYIATKGSAVNEFPWVKVTESGNIPFYRPISRPKKIQSNGKMTRLFMFSNLVLKDTLFRLRKAKMHSYPVDAGEEYERQMTSEIRTKSSAGKPEWRVVGNRANHLWDCEVIGLIAPTMLKIIGREARKNKPELDSESQDATPTSEQDQE